MTDTRKDKRAPVSLKVRFKSATVDEFAEHYCQDISRGGIFIKSRTPLPIGTLLKFEFQLKDESRVIHGVGRVVWKRSADESTEADAPPGMGIKFIKMDADSRNLVERIVASRGGGPAYFEAGAVGAEALHSIPLPGREPLNPSFFPSIPPAELPLPEDRTQVRHASEFLASALAGAGADETASREAERTAEQARRRTEEIERKRAEEYAQGAPQKVSMSPSIRVGQVSSAPSASISVTPPKERAPAPPPHTPTQPMLAVSDEVRREIEKQMAKAEPSKTEIATVFVKSQGKERAANGARSATSEATQSAGDAVTSTPFTASSSRPPRVGAEEPQVFAIDAHARGRRTTGPSTKAIGIGFALLLLVVVGYFALNKPARMEKTPAVDLQHATKTPSTSPPANIKAPSTSPVPSQPQQSNTPPNVATAPSSATTPSETTSVRVTTNPPGVFVEIEGKVLGKTPITLQLPVGKTTLLKLSAPGRVSIVRPVVAQPNQPPLQFALSRLSYVINVTSEPGGAYVGANGRSVQAPGALDLGPVRSLIAVIATKSGYATQRQSIPLTRFREENGQMRLDLHFVLEPLRPATPSSPETPSSDVSTSPPSTPPTTPPSGTGTTPSPPSTTPPPSSPSASPSAPSPAAPPSPPSTPTPPP